MHSIIYYVYKIVLYAHVDMHIRKSNIMHVHINTYSICIAEHTRAHTTCGQSLCTNEAYSLN